MLPTQACSIESCDKPAARRELCWTHYHRLKNWGDPNKTGVRGLTLWERALLSVSKEPNGCWLWLGCLNEYGYGVIREGKKVRRVHRVGYIATYGPVPDGLVLDHFYCDTKRCVNPDHVKPVTIKENSWRNNACISAQNALKTHCPWGHEYNDINTYLKKTKYGFSRQCRACKRVLAKAQKKKAMKKLSLNL